MGSDPRYPALDLGPHIDAIFNANSYDAIDLLTLVQAHVYSNSIEQFTHHVGLLLGWSTRGAALMWDQLSLPELD